MTDFPYALGTILNQCLVHCKWSATPYLCAGFTDINASVISFQIFVDSFTPLPKQNQLSSSLQVYTTPSSHCQTQFFLQDCNSLTEPAWWLLPNFRVRKTSVRGKQNGWKYAQNLGVTFQGYLLSMKPFVERQRMPGYEVDGNLESWKCRRKRLL